MDMFTPLSGLVRCDSAAARSYLHCHAERRPVMLSAAKHLVRHSRETLRCAQGDI